MVSGSARRDATEFESYKAGMPSILTYVPPFNISDRKIFLSYGKRILSRVTFSLASFQMVLVAGVEELLAELYMQFTRSHFAASSVLMKFSRYRLMILTISMLQQS